MPERPRIILGNMTITPKLLLQQSTFKEMIKRYDFSNKPCPSVSPTKKAINMV